ncbi:hypothetical protein ACS3UN_10350 [Oscillospiraceae bacterium LTW-04]|nr:hypothetical protein RBH76_12100 [Oscillospiraceae bacterium MB24-C1]
MIRMKVFKISPDLFDFPSAEIAARNDQSEKGKAKYQKKLARREEEYTLIEEFISEIGFENVRKITTSGDIYCLIYTIFYEDNGQGCR